MKGMFIETKDGEIEKIISEPVVEFDGTENESTTYIYTVNNATKEMNMHPILEIIHNKIKIFDDVAKFL